MWVQSNCLANNKQVVVGVVYRHPNYNLNSFTDRLNDVLLKLSSEGNTAFMTGDFNIDLMRINLNKNVELYVNMVLGYHFENIVTSPTRITANSSTLIDHFYNNNPAINVKTALILDDLSDHFPVVAIVKSKKKNVKNKCFYARNFANLNVNKLKDDAAVMITSITNKIDNDPNLCVNAKFKLLQDGIENIINENIPLRKLSHREARLKQKPWITKGILRSIKTRNLLYKKLCKSRFSDIQLENQYKKFRNKLTYIKQKSKSDYYQTLFSGTKGDVKKTWRILNGIIKKDNSNRESFIPKHLKINNDIISDPKTIVNHLNNHFSTIGKHSEEKVNFKEVSKTVAWQPNSIYFKKTNLAEIQEVINKLDSKKASGIDDISITVLKHLNYLLSPLLLRLINDSFESGEYPDCLKLAKVIPLHKGGSKEDPNNFRPISILSNLNKIIEKIIYSRLYQFFEKFNLLNQNQFGFRKGHSTNMAITEFLEEVLHNYDHMKATCAIFLDLSKAFDSVDRSILLFKLRRYGVRGKTWNLLESYLQNRRQIIQENNIYSNEAFVNIGVPQGSILGPLLFLIHISDLKFSTTLKIINFADDTLLYQEVDNVKDAQTSLNVEMEKVNQWMKTNQLKLNSSKTKFMVFNPSIKKFHKLDKLKLKMDNDKEIEQVEQFKYLGIIIDRKLNWKAHVQSIISKLSRTLGILYKVRYFLNKKLLLLLLNSLFLSHIRFGIICWGRCSTTVMRPISILLNKALRCINYGGYQDSSTPLYIKDNIIKVKDMFKFEVCKFMFSWGKNLLPPVFKKYFTNLENIHQHDTRRSKLNYYKNRKLTKTGMNTLNFIGVKIWNELPNGLKVKSTKFNFSNNVKRYFLDNYKNVN